MSNETKTKTVSREVFEPAWRKFHEDFNAKVKQSSANGYVKLSLETTFLSKRVYCRISWLGSVDDEPRVALVFAKALAQLAEYAKGFEYNGYTIIDD